MTNRKMTGRMPLLLLLLLLLLSAVVTTIAFVPSTAVFGVRRTSSNSYSLLLLTAKSNPTSDNAAASLSSSSSIAAPRPASSLPPRQSKIKKSSKKTKKKAKKQKKSSSSSSPLRCVRNRPLSEDEIADHVSHLYLHGPGGILRGKVHEFGVTAAAAAAAAAVPLNNNNNESNDDDNQKHARMRHSSEDNDNTHEQPRTLLSSCPQQENYHKLDRHPTLVLNADYQPVSHLPLSLWHWQEAVKSVFTGKVHVVDVYPDVTIRAANLEIPLPSVIALTEYVPPIQSQQKPAFTKRNVFLRDEYRCQYCNQRFHTRDLSLDHVHPRCMGGRLHWENAVTACSPCNGKKGSRAVSELRSIGMRLLRPPRIPTQYELAAISGRMVPRKVHPTWEPFLAIATASSSVGGSGGNGGSTRKQQNKAKSMGEQQQQQQRAL